MFSTTMLSARGSCQQAHKSGLQVCGKPGKGWVQIVNGTQVALEWDGEAGCGVRERTGRHLRAW